MKQIPTGLSDRAVAPIMAGGRRRLWLAGVLLLVCCSSVVIAQVVDTGQSSCYDDWQEITCSQTPGGAKLCIPACRSDSDCPKPPGVTLRCHAEQGICAPQDGQTSRP
jgi:hypothetical protein